MRRALLRYTIYSVNNGARQTGLFLRMSIEKPRIFRKRSPEEDNDGSILEEVKDFGDMYCNMQ